MANRLDHVMAILVLAFVSVNFTFIFIVTFIFRVIATLIFIVSVISPFTFISTFIFIDSFHAISPVLSSLSAVLPVRTHWQLPSHSKT